MLADMGGGEANADLGRFDLLLCADRLRAAGGGVDGT
jgi:hypothetical protein